MPDGLGDDWLPLLTHPTTGCPVFLEAAHARFRLFEELRLVEPGQRPHSVLGQASTHFDVHVPPRVSA